MRKGGSGFGGAVSVLDLHDVCSMTQINIACLLNLNIP